MKPVRNRSKKVKVKRNVIGIDFCKYKTLYDKFEKGTIKYNMSASDYARRLIAIGLDVVEKDPMRLLSHGDSRFTAYEMTKGKA
jgi:hypothetical protein